MVIGRSIGSFSFFFFNFSIPKDDENRYLQRLWKCCRSNRVLGSVLVQVKDVQDTLQTMLSIKTQ